MRLPDTSLTHALMRGGREHFGFGLIAHLLADNYDAINQGTLATGNWKKTPPKIPLWPRPSVGERDAETGDFVKPEARKTSLKDIFNKLTRR